MGLVGNTENAQNFLLRSLSTCLQRKEILGFVCKELPQGTCQIPWVSRNLTHGGPWWPIPWTGLVCLLS